MATVRSFAGWTCNKGTLSDYSWEAPSGGTVPTLSCDNVEAGTMKINFDWQRAEGAAVAGVDIYFYNNSATLTKHISGRGDHEIEVAAGSVKISFAFLSAGGAVTAEWARITLTDPAPAGTNKLRIGRSSPSALMFNAPQVGHDYEIDFSGWEVNPYQADGVKLEDGRIVVTKVRPNVWFIRSAHGFKTAAERNAQFYGKTFKISGLAALADVATEHKMFSSWDGSSITARGLVITPCTSDGALLCSTNDGCNNMGIYNGYFKNPNNGALKFGYLVDGDQQLYNYNPGYDNYPEVALAFFTDAAVGSDGFLELPAPLTIGSVDRAAFDPATREGWRAALGRTTVYEKMKTFRNCLMRFGIAFEETGTYTTPVQGLRPNIVESRWQRNNGPAGDPVAFVATARQYADQYDRVRFPVPTDLAELIRQGWPMKFWANQVDVDGKPGFWNAVVSAFRSEVVRDGRFFDHLFATSNIKGALGGGDGFLQLTFESDESGDGHLYNRLTFDAVFDWAGIDKVRVIVRRGYLATLTNAFRQTKSLEAVEFVNETGDDDLVAPFQWSGAFEHSALPAFPTGIGVTNLEDSSATTAGKCQISYAFNGAVFPTIGNLKSDGSRWTMLVHPYCVSAFDGWTGTEIIYDLNFMYVTPGSSWASRVLMCSGLKTSRIAGLNKGDWSLDGVSRGGVVHGNLPNLDAGSVDYLLRNLFDLRTNATLPDSREEKTPGLTSAKLYLRAELQSIATSDALAEASARGWTVVFGG